MSERAITDPSQHGWVDAGDGKWMWGGSGGGDAGGGSITDGTEEGQVTRWNGSEWVPNDDVFIYNTGTVGFGDKRIRVYLGNDGKEPSISLRNADGSEAIRIYSDEDDVVTFWDAVNGINRMNMDASGNMRVHGTVYAYDFVTT